MREIVPCLLLVLVGLVACADDTRPRESDVVGDWTLHARPGDPTSSARLVLRADGTYEGTGEATLRDLPTKVAVRADGRWRLEGDRVVMTGEHRDGRAIASDDAARVVVLRLRGDQLLLLGEHGGPLGASYARD